MQADELTGSIMKNVSDLLLFHYKHALKLNNFIPSPQLLFMFSFLSFLITRIEEVAKIFFLTL
jgi:hypothetical protein